MAKLEIELSDNTARLLRDVALRTGKPESKIVESAVEMQYGLSTKEEPRESVNHEQWLRRFDAWQARLRMPNGHLTDEDLRRVNIYDDERG